MRARGLRCGDHLIARHALVITAASAQLGCDFLTEMPIGEGTGRMDDDERWRDPAAYLYGLALDEAEWAWEFLRRNRRFREAIGPPPATDTSTIAGPQPGAAEVLEAWGLHFRARRRRARRSCRRCLAAELAR